MNRNEKNLPLLLDLLLTFMKVGFFTFGGGYAMISVIEDICVEKKKWITHEEMMNMTIIAESTPGPIAINCATFVGQKQGGFAGSVIATFGIALPSFLVIYLIASVLPGFLEITLISKAMQGIKAGVSLLILSVGLTMLGKMQKKPFPGAVCGCAFAVMLLSNLMGFGVSTISLMIAAGFAGFLFCKSGKGGGRK